VSEKEPFNPKAHLIRIKGGAEYLETKWRLVWLRDVHPEASIITTPHFIDEQRAVIHTEVSIPGERLPWVATGIGSEERTDFNDYIEKAETKAIGRALAAAGFGTQFTDDFDTPVTADGRDRIVDSPVTRSYAAQDAPQRTESPRMGGDTISEKQLKYLHVLMTERGVDEQMLKDSTGVVSLKDLTKRQASEAIERLQAMPIKADEPATQPTLANTPEPDDLDRSWSVFWSWARANGMRSAEDVQAVGNLTEAQFRSQTPTGLRTILETKLLAVGKP
jgi:hypothetical protein